MQAIPGGFETVTDVIAVVGTLMLVLILVAFVGFAYKSLRGDGIEWPEDVEEEGGVQSGDEDDEWDYY